MRISIKNTLGENLQITPNKDKEGKYDLSTYIGPVRHSCRRGCLGTIKLSDGTVLENIGLTGNNYISEEKIDDSVFNDEALKHVTIENVDTEQYRDNVDNQEPENLENVSTPDYAYQT